ncbi:MAG TPA: glucose-6-phosphate isomerase [Verrucomicrobiales bacterium]|nr:glucose-6-phosphate isomerase [Verrucomicrobiales bacterium]
MASLFQRYCQHLVRYEDMGISLDVSRMNFGDDFLTSMQAKTDKALKDMKALEGGAIANPDEKRMVGHYWLRNPELAPAELRDGIRKDIQDSKEFAERVHDGRVKAERGGKFTRILVIGIGGSALGPQLVADALVDPWTAPVRTHFFDNTDPNGMQRVLSEVGDDLASTLTIVISKSGGTAETRNGMLEAKAAYEKRGLDFGKHAVAVTGVDSKLEGTARKEGWLHIFPMTDWVGGRTSVMSTVGLVPAALQRVDIDRFLAGAAAMDELTRSLPPAQNLSMMLALMWYHAGGGKGAKDMVILPYKDRLVLLSKYLQQLVMESLGKTLDLDGNVVHQGIAVYGNKGSTDQHAYVQQLRDGVNNFFATLVEVRDAQDGDHPVQVESGVTSADYLQGFLRGTRRALFENGRENMTLSIPKLDAFNLGAVIAAFERAVGFYASLVNINAYHQPGVEAGKKAAGEFLKVLASVKAGLNSTSRTAGEIGTALSIDPEDALHSLMHLAANDSAVKRFAGSSPAEDRFSL